MARERRRKNNGDEGAPAWVVTYGDMMSLLLTFFIFLFSFSTIDAVEFKELMDKVRVQLGILSGGRTLSDGPAPNRGLDGVEFSPVDEESEFQDLIEQVESYVKQENLEGDVALELDQRGLVIRFTGQVLYDLGKAELKPIGASVLNTIGQFLQDIPNHIAIEGHTDNLPIKNEQFADNWALSSARANEVIRYFLEKTRIIPERLSTSGYGEYQPLVPNNSEDNRAKNRRVDIVILKTRLEDQR